MSKLPLLIVIGGKRSSWFHRVGGLSIRILLLVISLYGLAVATGCGGNKGTAGSPCTDPCDQATLDVRIADVGGVTGKITYEPASPVQGCPLTIKWQSCYDEILYTSKLTCFPATFSLTFTGTKELVTIGDTKTAKTVSEELDDTIDVGCESREKKYSDLKAGDYWVVVELDHYGKATECDKQNKLGLPDLNTDNYGAVNKITVACPCQDHESYDLRIADLAYDDATQQVGWSACVDWVACTDPAEVITFDETIDITQMSSGDVRTASNTGVPVTMGECVVRSFDMPAGAAAGDYQIKVTLTAQAPFADCDPATATKLTVKDCKQIPDLATNNSSSLPFTVE
jgi:hypothetical protein